MRKSRRARNLAYCEITKEVEPRDQEEVKKSKGLRGDRRSGKRGVESWVHKQVG